MSGSWGHAGAFSFYPTKNLGALGDAGAMVTKDPDLAAKCRMIANHGQSTRDEHQVLGRNSRMDSLQAAVLNFRLEQLYACNVQRRLLARLYHEHLQDLPLTLPHEKEGFFHVYHLFVISTRERDALRTFLGEKGIGTLIHYPVAVSDMAHLNPSPAPLASQLSQEILSLPLYPEMTEEEILEVCQAIRKYFEG
jgi:dTDP-4-amino-4,6-dideoxygalactose transaminase